VPQRLFPCGPHLLRHGSDAGPARRDPAPCRTPLLPGSDTVAFTGIDSMQKRICGRHKHGAAFRPIKIYMRDSGRHA
jgi:hypothetical protein